MSWNPRPGFSGATWAKAYEKGEKYRRLYVMEDTVKFDSLYRKSKYLYYWYRNEQVRNASMALKELISTHDLNTFKEFKDRIFPKLVELLD